MLQGPVLIATNFTDAAAEALHQGHELAGLLGVPFTIGHVVPDAYRVRVLFPQEAGPDLTMQHALVQRATDALRLQARAVLNVDLSPSQMAVETGSPHAGIIAMAKHLNAGVIVIGPGATAQRVTRAAVQPVWIARPSPTGGAVLGATDFSDPALPALHLAAAEAARRHLRLRILHCLDLDASSYLATAGAPGVLAAAPLPDAEIRRLEQQARRQILAAFPDGAEIVVQPGAPHSAIVREAADTATSLVVVGAHGRSAVARLALGSVAESVVREAPCSVLVVPLSSAQSGSGSA